MWKTACRRPASIVAGLAAVTLIATACGSDGGEGREDASPPATTTTETVSPTASPTSSTADSSAAAPVGDVKLRGADGSMVTLTGPIAAKYSTATAAQKKSLGVPLTGDRNAGERDSGVVYQQFRGGVITAKNDDPGTPAFITWGKIRDAWNIERAPDGTPSITGKNGSAGPLGVATSDETTNGDLRESTFEHGKISFNTKTGKVTVTVNDKVVPAE
ncbi:hypothetical protein GOARA_064_00170 [Gordonia araii NBRC 100433]|uniref:LGFP repeat protein n=1 Tax=Gordonia araii NBRC 100433 TaxID=1073574 RepID=G7H590_9ACTN|nr:hypothetical protein [Gordonia araii]NNG95730.1 hypothetical protein [Gordonia araii NBRC 100433]GAB11015.1 hypothetical protein GOARA_064_00170 [Gordonia araii NBRC 100433]